PLQPAGSAAGNCRFVVNDTSKPLAAMGPWLKDVPPEASESRTSSLEPNGSRDRYHCTWNEPEAVLPVLRISDCTEIVWPHCAASVAFRLAPERSMVDVCGGAPPGGVIVRL